jgi:phage host-nuclease inhibitor protein Gam
MGKLNPLVVRRSNQITSLFSFANPLKDELTKKVRSIVLPQGTFGWRMTTPRVEMKKSDEQMIAFLKKINQNDYIRVIEEIDRQALLADRPEIAGISYVQNDEFFVIPKQKAKRPKTLTQAIDRENE